MKPSKLSSIAKGMDTKAEEKAEKSTKPTMRTPSQKTVSQTLYPGLKGK